MAESCEFLERQYWRQHPCVLRHNLLKCLAIKLMLLHSPLYSALLAVAAKFWSFTWMNKTFSENELGGLRSSSCSLGQGSSSLLEPWNWADVWQDRLLFPQLSAQQLKMTSSWLQVSNLMNNWGLWMRVTARRERGRKSVAQFTGV